MGTETAPAVTAGRDKWTVMKAIKTVLVVLYFVNGALAICFSQLVIKALTFYDEALQRSLLNFTKQNFIILLVSVLQVVSPSKLIITHDASIPDEAFQSIKEAQKGKVKLRSYLETNAIVIANHQVYIDWVYLWFFAYCNEIGNNIYIIMKESLRKIPVLGYGMANYNFIFLFRKWEADRSVMTDQLAKIDQYQRVLTKHLRFPDLKQFWIILFPEGTNMSDDRLAKSEAWSDKIGTPRLRNVLVPRVKGLYFTTLKLAQSTKTIYNLTIGYSGVKQEQFAQDVYTMPKIFLHGKGPKEIHIHFSKSNVDEIENFKYDQKLTEEEDLANMNNFEKWLTEKWYEKDALMGDFYESGAFGKGRYAQHVVPLKINSRLEVLRIFAVPWATALFIYLIYYYAIA